MKIWYALFSEQRGQLKIQQMSFVLVALMIFFAMAGLFFLSVGLRGLEKDAVALEDEETLELVRKLASSPEFLWDGKECSHCIDLDKVLLLKERAAYENFWGLDFLQIERVYPMGEGECEQSSYPACQTITLGTKKEVGSPKSSFVSLCRWESQKGGYVKCELGRIHASGKGIDE